MNPFLKAIISAYSASKVLRLGVAYLETEERHRHLLSRELGLNRNTLKVYGRRAKETYTNQRP